MKRDKDGFTWATRNSDWWLSIAMLLVFLDPFLGEGFFPITYPPFVLILAFWFLDFAAKNRNYTRKGLMLGCLAIPLLFAGIYRLFPLKTCLTGSLTNSSTDYLYFSYTTYTTLGYGEIQPIGWCRLLSSVEAMIGLLFTAYVAAVIFRKYQLAEKG